MTTDENYVGYVAKLMKPAKMLMMFRRRKCRASGSWRMEETYLKTKGKWVYYYRAVDKYGAVIDFYLSETRDVPATWH